MTLETKYLDLALKNPIIASASPLNAKLDNLRVLEDVVKCLLAGADVVMTTSALLRNGIGYVSTLTTGLHRWMQERELASPSDMRGMMTMQRNGDRSVYTRANYLRILEHYTAA